MKLRILFCTSIIAAQIAYTPLLLGDENSPAFKVNTSTELNASSMQNRIPIVVVNTSGKPTKVFRHIVEHPISTMRDCSYTQIRNNYEILTNTIAVGAPIFNRGEHDTCFILYERTASSMESNPQTCKAVRHILGAGLNRAENLQTPVEKAWALRDTFDGLLKVMKLKLADTTSPTPLTRK